MSGTFGRSLALAVTLLAFALRVYRLTAQSLWFDEGWSVYLARQPVADALPLIASQGHTHPPGYYLLLHAWTLVAGTSEFAVRFLSVATGVLLVAGAYALIRRWFGALAALLAAGILTFSPVHVTYSQETRMYALLALEYLALLALTCIALQGKPNWRHWLALLVAEVAALYTHYFAGVLLIYLNAFVVLSTAGLKPAVAWRRATDMAGFKLALLKPWVATQVLALVAFLPWLGVALRQTSEHVPRDVQPPGLAEFLAQTWHFFNAGSLGPIGHDALLTGLSTSLGVVTAAALLLSAAGDHSKSKNQNLKSKIESAVILAAHGLVPLAALFVIAQLRPGVHPRYVIMLSVPLFLALACSLARMLESQWTVWRMVAAGVGVLLLATFGAGLNVAYFDGRYFRDDVRGLARFLEETATADDLVLFDYDDYAFRYYDRGPASVAYLSAAGDSAAIAAELARLTAGKGRVFRIAWTQGQSDYRGLFPFLLERAGRLEDRRDFTGLSLFQYALERSVDLPPIALASADFGAVRLAGAYAEDGAPADNAVAIGLRWVLPAPTDRRLKAAVRLVDPLGNILARADVFLLDAAGWGTPAWLAGEDVTHYVILPLPRGTPPLDYALRLGVYDTTDPGGLDVLDAAGAPQGREVSLGRVRLSPPAGYGADPYRIAGDLALQPVDATLAPGLVLDAYAITREQVNPGEKLEVILRWRAGQMPLPVYRPRLRLIRDGAVIVEAVAAPGYGRYPTTAWSAGEIVLDWRELRIPAEVAPGPARPELVVDGGQAVSLAEVSIAASERVFTVPPMSYTLGRRFPGVAELLGYDVQQESGGAGEQEGSNAQSRGPDWLQDESDSAARLRVRRAVRLTLYWRALAGDSGERPAYTVFTHMLNPDGVLVGQHDGPPAEGRRPTTSWVVGEVITDVHVMQFREPGYAGPVLIEVGLYDPVTGVRVPAEDGRDQIVLPVQLMIVP